MLATPSLAYKSRTTIICTLGPATETQEGVEALLAAGADVIRLNFSHGTHEYKKQHINVVRAAEKSAGRPVAILQDLQGPKLRVGELENDEPVTLHDDAIVTLTTEPCVGSAERISVTYSHLPADVAKDDPILLADGAIVLRVLNVENDTVQCRVMHGGLLYPRKGVNLPGVNLSIPSLTEKDKEDLAFGIANGVDWIALSFVRHADDIHTLRAHIAELWDATAHPPHTQPPRIIAKIEKPEAVQHLDDIADAADALMVARGDLGVEISPERVPVVQKNIIAAGTKRGKPVITATQMLESMIHSPIPTRAEASDVANAIFDGTDAVMLSAETATGRYPTEAVAFLARVANEVEAHQPVVPLSPDKTACVTDAIAVAAHNAAFRLNADLITVYTHSGYSATRIAACRPHIPILALCSNISVCRQLMLYWNMCAELAPVCASRKELRRLADERTSPYLNENKGMYILVSGSKSLPGQTDSFQVRQIL